MVKHVAQNGAVPRSGAIRLPGVSARDPSLAREQALWSSGLRLVVGVDEVGVGPLCGAVVAAAVRLDPDVDPALLAGVRDSKTIASGRRREELAQVIRQVADGVAVGAASPREIDRLNVRGATALAMQRALARIGPYEHALLDGRPMPQLDPAHHTFVIDGDALCLSVACASIVAKVVRDRLMRQLAQRYPLYGWEHNAGYATADHLRALREHGPTPHHRLRYRPVVQAELDLGLDGPRFGVAGESSPGALPPATRLSS